jgi:hypothetical protein
MSQSALGQSFFAFSSEYSKQILDEFYVLAKILHMSYTDFLKTPVYVRRYLIDKMIRDSEKQN